jgi:hypothetical protein
MPRKKVFLIAVDRSGNIPIEFLEGFSIKDLPWKN